MLSPPALSFSSLIRLKSSLYGFRLQKKKKKNLAAVTRPREYSDKAISKPRWFLSVQGSWICPPVVPPRQVDSDDEEDGVSDHWSHLDSLKRKKIINQHSIRRALVVRKGRNIMEAVFCMQSKPYGD